MTDPPSPQAQLFLGQAEQARGRSPLYADLCERFANDPIVAEIIESPPRWDAPLRLLCGLHFLVLDGRASWDQIDEALEAHREFLTRFVATQSIQTNEVQRCWMLLPCFLELAARYDVDTFDVIELGASAGLNLTWDNYRYRYGPATWGPADAPLELAGDVRRAPPAELFERRPTVRSRIGIDLDPIDVTSDAGARLLKSFVWADQTARLDRLDEAISVARAHPPTLIQGDIAEELPDLLAARRTDGLTVVWQTAVLGYLAEDRRQLVEGALAAAGSTGPLAFVGTTAANEESALCYGLTVQCWPGGEPEQLAHADFHGAWLDWLDPSERRRRPELIVAF